MTSWGIKLLKSSSNNGNGIFIGVAPSSINQNESDNSDKCGWYLNCYNLTLCSGPPHNYSDKEYGPKKEEGQYVHTGYCVGVVMDTTKGDLSFALSGVNLGVAYEKIPRDKPLVPCVILRQVGDSVEFDPSEVKENLNEYIPIPPASQQRASPGTPSPSHGILLKRLHSTKLMWMGTSSGARPPQTNS